ncbi:MAG: hypothetical protein BWY87_01658 [Deltaproteobacteria bacterium ADurb.Bin510]|nr:MAG: hypothetical protein BWY87_01658 [Deltaproteobacteria bacterium ADurb.Bin510]
MTQGFDVQAQGRHRVGDPVEFLLGDFTLWHGKHGDLVHAQPDEIGGGVQLQHIQGTEHLIHQPGHQGQGTPLGTITEEGVEDGLDLMQVGLDLLSNLGGEQFFLRLTRKIIEQRQAGQGFQRFPGIERGTQATAQQCRLSREFVTEDLEVIQGVLGKQQAGGQFQMQGFVLHGLGYAGERLAHLCQGIGQFLERGVAQSPRHFATVAEHLLQGGQGIGLARGIAQPVLLGLLQRLAQTLERGPVLCLGVRGGRGRQMPT